MFAPWSAIRHVAGELQRLAVTVQMATDASLESSMELAELLRLAMRRLRRGTRDALAPLGLSGSEARVVRLLADGSLRMSVIAGRLAVVPRTVTDLVDGAELAGFVARLADPEDRRSTLVELTPVGRRLLDQVDSARRESAARVFGTLTEGQRGELLALLRTICTPRRCRMRGRQMLRAMGRDPSVTSQQLSSGLFRRIAMFAKPYRRKIIGFLILIIIDAAVGATNPLIYRAIIDDGIIAKHTDIVIELAVLLAVLAVLDAVLMLFERLISSRIGQGLIFDMRTKVFAHFQEMPIAFFSRTQTGALISRLNNDVLDAQSAFTGTLSSVVGNLISVAVTLVAMFVLSWQITLLALVIFPVFILPARWMGRRIQAITRESYNLNSSMVSMMSERFNVAGALLVKLFGQPEREVRKFEEKAGRVRDIGVLQTMYNGIFMAALLLTASLATALVYGLGGLLATSGALQVGTLVALSAYLGRLYGPLTSLSNVQVSVMTALVSFDRIFEVLDLAPMVAEKPDAVEIHRGPAKIEFEHVDFSYPRAEDVSLASLESVANLDQAPSQQVLADVSFVAPPGALIALVGPSGAGKTTIGNLVMRLYDVNAGAVLVNDLDVRDVTLDSLHRAIGVVTQDAHLFHDTIRANLLYAKPGRDRIGARRGAARRADPAARGIAAGRPRHGRRRPWLPTLGRREAAHGDRPPPAQGARHRRPRRGDRAPRLGVGARAAAGASDGPRRTYVDRHCAPPLDGARGRPDPGGLGRAHHRARQARRTARGGRPVCRAVRDPVCTAGGR